MRNVERMRGHVVERADAAIDQGLRAYMLGVYNLMAIGLVVTALVSMATAYFASTNEAFFVFLYTSPFAYVVMFAPLIAVFFMSFKIHTLSTSVAQGLFLGFAALIGLSISSIFFVYQIGSVTQVFFITAAAFGSLSLYGYTTKRDLRPLGTFLFIGLVGLILASIVNLFTQSGALHFAISVIGVLIFAGLTAYDTQNIKAMYYEGDSVDSRGRKIVMGALQLYLDFINMFIFLLRLLGNRD